MNLIYEQSLLPVETLVEKLSRPQPCDSEPVYCVTSDLDWACEPAIEMLLRDLDSAGITPTLFMTHQSPAVDRYFTAGKVERGVHPNFLPGSSHGDTFETILEHTMAFAPESQAARAHRAFSVTDVSHLLAKRGFKFTSNFISILQPQIRPMLHESNLIEFPVCFEDGTHLFNGFDLSFADLLPHLQSPGLKILSFHPMNYGVNPPTLAYMRHIKDTLSREAYVNMTQEVLGENRYKGRGISDLSKDVFDYLSKLKTYSLAELYSMAIG